MNDLPSYPTPKQAAYVVQPSSSSSSGRRHKPSHSNVNYKPPSTSNNPYNRSNQYNQHMPPPPSSSASHSHNVNSAPQPIGQVHFQSGGPPPQSNYYQLPSQSSSASYQQPPPSQNYYHQQSQPPPPPPQQQNYYQQQSQPPIQQQPPPPQPINYQQPPGPGPQQRSPSHGYQNMSSSPMNQPSFHQQTPQAPIQQRYESHAIKKPPPPIQPQSSSSMLNNNNVPPVPSVSKNRSKESLHEKSSSKQKLEYELRSVFDKVDINNSGKISKIELSNALLNFDHTKFSDSTVTLMINLFGNSNSSTKHLNFDQFVSLWKYLSAYKKLFVQADSNSSGDISFGEFQKILEQIGYKLNIDLVLHLFQKFSYKDFDSSDASVGTLKFDKFIELLVYLRKLTDVFKKYDKDLSGVATINFLDFLLEISNLS